MNDFLKNKKELTNEELVEQIILFQNNRNKVVDFMNYPDLVNIQFGIEEKDKSTEEKYNKRFVFFYIKNNKKEIILHEMYEADLSKHSYDDCEQRIKELFYRRILRKLFIDFFKNNIIE